MKWNRVIESWKIFLATITEQLNFDKNVFLFLVSIKFLYNVHIAVSEVSPVSELEFSPGKIACENGKAETDFSFLFSLRTSRQVQELWELFLLLGGGGVWSVCLSTT